MDYTPHTQGTLVDAVYEIIKKEIASSYLQPGDKLNSRILSERYHVSETPIKQALNRLITEGLVESIPRKGMRVRNISWTEIHEILELRLMLDLFFVPDVIRNFHADHTLAKQMEDVIQWQVSCMDSLEDTNSYNRTYELDNRFHELYITFSGSRKALDLFHNMNSHVYSSFIYGHQPVEQTLEGIREHKNILNALIDGDEETTRTLLTAHIRNAESHIHAALQNKEEL